MDTITNTARFAKDELDILLKTVEEPIIAPFYSEIISLCEKFGQSGQSGGSAAYVATALSQAIKKLCLQETICDITGVDDEWVSVAETGEQGDIDILYQNNRCSGLFRNKDGRCWFLDAIIWKNQDGQTYSGSAIMADGTEIGSRQYIKSFPFKPKTFYIDRIDTEVAKDDWVSHVKNEKQIEKVWEYYDRYQ